MIRRFFRWLLNKDELDQMNRELRQIRIELERVHEMLIRVLEEDDEEPNMFGLDIQTIGAIGPIKNKVRNQSRA